MIVRTLRTSLLAVMTTLMLSAGVGVASAQEGPIDHLRHRTHQIIYLTDRAIRHHRPVVVRVYEPRHRRHHVHARYYRVRAYDRRHHRYYYRTYRRY